MITSSKEILNDVDTNEAYNCTKNTRYQKQCSLYKNSIKRSLLKKRVDFCNKQYLLLNSKAMYKQKLRNWTHLGAMVFYEMVYCMVSFYGLALVPTQGLETRYLLYLKFSTLINTCINI